MSNLVIGINECIQLLIKGDIGSAPADFFSCCPVFFLQIHIPHSPEDMEIRIIILQGLIQDIQILQLLLRGQVNPVSLFQFLNLFSKRWRLLTGIFHISLSIAGRYGGRTAYDDCRAY